MIFIALPISLLTLTLIAFKVVGLLTLSWWWVFSPVVLLNVTVIGYVALMFILDKISELIHWE